MDRSCDHCGKPIEPGKRQGTLYCSGSCRTAAYRQKQRIKATKAHLNQDHGKSALLAQFTRIMPETSKRLNEFVLMYGGDCAEAAVKLALAAYAEARQTAA